MMAAGGKVVCPSGADVVRCVPGLWLSPPFPCLRRPFDPPIPSYPKMSATPALAPPRSRFVTRFPLLFNPPAVHRSSSLPPPASGLARRGCRRQARPEASPIVSPPLQSPPSGHGNRDLRTRPRRPPATASAPRSPPSLLLGTGQAAA